MHLQVLWDISDARLHEGAAGGLASIKIDNNDGNFVEMAPAGGLDMYSATPAWQQKYAITGLTNGWHNVVVKSLNPSHNAASSGWFVYVDGFDVDPVAQNPVDRSENNYDGQIGYHWETLANAKADGLSMSLNGAFQGACGGFTFTGTSVSYVYEKTPAGGLADVYIDGDLPGHGQRVRVAGSWQATQDYGPFGNTTHTHHDRQPQNSEPAVVEHVHLRRFVHRPGGHGNALSELADSTEDDTLTNAQGARRRNRPGATGARGCPCGLRFSARARKLAIPLHISFELTKRCNLACRHCYIVPGDAELPGYAGSSSSTRSRSWAAWQLR